LLEFYEDKRLGMPQAALQPPSKPVHPRYSSRCVAAEAAARNALKNANDSTGAPTAPGRRRLQRNMG